MRSEAFWQWFEAEARPKLFARANTFAKIFEYLDHFDRPVGIVETGCTRRGDSADAWKGDGCATILFDRYAQAHPGSTVNSVDLDAEAVRECRALVSPAVAVHQGDSIEFLGRMAADPAARPLDLLYHDAYDFALPTWTLCAAHHLNELIAALPMVRRDTLVVVDDSISLYDDFPPRYEVGGKGAFIALHAKYVGADLLFSEYQVGWTNITATVERRPETVDDLILRARACTGEQAMRAEALYRRVLELTTPPRGGVDRVAHGEACIYYAHAAITAKRYGTALDWYRQALQVDPLATDYRLDYALKVLSPMGLIEQAKIEATTATRIEPDYPQAWRILGAIEQDLNNADGCVSAFDKQLALAPESLNAILDRCGIAIDHEDHVLATKLANKGLGTEKHGDALHAFGMIAYREGRHEDAIAFYDEAFAHGVQSEGRLRWNKSLALQSIGRLREAWAEFRYREKFTADRAACLPVTRFVKPLWTGQPAPAIIHVHTEAGSGDNILYARFFPLMIERGYKVHYETAGFMVDLMRSSFSDVEVFPLAPDYPGAVGLIDFHYHIPIGNLPAVFGTDLATIPTRHIPYIKPDRHLVAHYRERVPAGSIGLCWSSGIRPGIWLSRYGAKKSMHYNDLWENRLVGDAAEDPPFVSLQVGPERAQHGGNIIDVLPAEPTWADTAALVANLDLVITVDTAVAHLAGAMGKPTWLMCQSDSPSLHFMAERPGAPWNERSPWYPSIYIYRQSSPGDWGGVVGRIAHDLSLFNRAAIAG